MKKLINLVVLVLILVPFASAQRGSPVRGPVPGSGSLIPDWLALGFVGLILLFLLFAFLGWLGNSFKDFKSFNELLGFAAWIAGTWWLDSTTNWSFWACLGVGLIIAMAVSWLSEIFYKQVIRRR